MGQNFTGLSLGARDATLTVQPQTEATGAAEAGAPGERALRIVDLVALA